MRKHHARYGGRLIQLLCRITENISYHFSGYFRTKHLLRQRTVAQAALCSLLLAAVLPHNTLSATHLWQSRTSAQQALDIQHFPPPRACVYRDAIRVTCSGRGLRSFAVNNAAYSVAIPFCGTANNIL